MAKGSVGSKNGASGSSPSNQTHNDVDSSLKEQEKLAADGRKAALSAARQKLLNDLNDAVASFIKNIGSSVKAAAQ